MLDTLTCPQGSIHFVDTPTISSNNNKYITRDWRCYPVRKQRIPLDPSPELFIAYLTLLDFNNTTLYAFQ